VTVEPTLLLAVVTTGVAVAYITFVVGVQMQRSRSGSSRRLAGLRPERDVMEQNLVERALIPAMRRLGAFGMRFTPQAWAQRTRRRLIRAAWYPAIDETSWAAIRVISLVAAVVGYLVLAGVTDGATRWLLLFIFGLAGYAGPDQILNRRVTDRVNAIERDLPDLIDLLVISIEAGLGFEMALDRVVQHVPGELSDEFSRMLQETRVGVSRYEAMRSLADRTDVDVLNSFVLAMNQADTFGVSIGRMLRVQADEMRIRRRQRAQEKAFAAPVKMVVPLVLCIFPAIFIVLLGPAAINIMRNLAG
jgi:tight adherence protein C